jgi:hypothetical protein
VDEFSTSLRLRFHLAQTMCAERPIPGGLHPPTQPDSDVILHAAFDNGCVRNYSLRDIICSASTASAAAAAVAATTATTHIAHSPIIRTFSLGLPLVRQHDAQVTRVPAFCNRFAVHLMQLSCAACCSSSAPSRILARIVSEF